MSQPLDPRTVLFISDLHLTAERPAQAELFRRFMADIAPQARALYILGDFFEAWVGDDDLTQTFHADIAATLKQYAEQGLALYFMAGNRDFLAGPALAEATGWTHLEDPCVIDLFGVPTLLSHGDAWCTDDDAYQAFRRQVRTPAWQQQFLAQPIDARHATARSIREHSEQAKTEKRPSIMDVNPEAVRQALGTARVTRLIHGHTHRPAHHVLEVQGTQAERWVLPDWYETGGYLVCTPEGCRLEMIP
ncbi:MAG: UDP-2,3-diacylglucosamine diphosphatase [Pseudomonadota bacterium]